MRIGDTVVRVKEEHNLRKIGDIAIVDGLKIYNKGVCVHLEGDKSDTWNSESNYRNIEDVDMPCLQLELRTVEKEIHKHTAEFKALTEQRRVKRMATIQRKKMSAIEILDKMVGVNVDEPEDDVNNYLVDPINVLEDDEPFDFPEGTFEPKKSNLLSLEDLLP